MEIEILETELMEKKMITLSRRAIRFYGLLTSMLVLLFHTGVVCAGMEGEQSDGVVHEIGYEGFIDFMDGRIERLNDGSFKLMDMEFQLSADMFCAKGEEVIPCDQIKTGDEVRITYAPDEDNRVLKMEMEENSRALHKKSVHGAQNRREKHEVIVFKNGVYTNE